MTKATENEMKRTMRGNAMARTTTGMNRSQWRRSMSSMSRTMVMVCAMIMMMAMSMGVSVRAGGSSSKITLPFFSNASTTQPCAIITFKSFSAALIINASAPSEQGRLTLPEFNASSATFESTRVPACANASKETTLLSLGAVFRLKKTNETARVGFTFHGTTSDGKVSKWYLHNITGTVAHKGSVFQSSTNYPTASDSTFSSPSGYSVQCKAHADFGDNVDGGLAFSFVNALIQPFNVRTNQTKPLPKKGERYDICQFQKDQQDHTLALAIAGGVGALCLCAIVVYVLRSRHKSAYTSLT